MILYQLRHTKPDITIIIIDYDPNPTSIPTHKKAEAAGWSFKGGLASKREIHKRVRTRWCASRNQDSGFRGLWFRVQGLRV